MTTVDFAAKVAAAAAWKPTKRQMTAEQFAAMTAQVTAAAAAVGKAVAPAVAAAGSVS